MKDLLKLLGVVALFTLTMMLGCALGEGEENYYVSFTVDGDTDFVWTKGDTDFSAEVAGQDSDGIGVIIEAFPVEESGVQTFIDDVDNGIYLLADNRQPGVYTGEDIEFDLVLDGVAYEGESAGSTGTVEITSSGGIGEVVEGKFSLSFTSPSALEVTDGRFRVLLLD
jgi:hypothetical protein